MFDDILWRIIFIIAAFLVAYVITGTVFKRIEKNQNGLHIQFSKQLIRALLAILAIVLIGAQFTTPSQIGTMLVAGSGLFIAIAGFAAQQTLADVIAGFMISLAKPYNTNERITLINSNITGVVEGITMRHTIIRLFDNNRLIIPNSVMNKEVIKNSNYEDSKIGNFLDIEISYESDVDTAITIIKEVLAADEMVVDKENISVMIRDFVPNGIALKTTVWTEDVNHNFVACSNIRKEILKRFKEAGVVISYPRVIVINDNKDGDN